MPLQYEVHYSKLHQILQTTKCLVGPEYLHAKFEWHKISILQCVLQDVFQKQKTQHIRYRPNIWFENLHIYQSFTLFVFHTSCQIIKSHILFLTPFYQNQQTELLVCWIGKLESMKVKVDTGNTWCLSISLSSDSVKYCGANITATY